MVDKTLLYIDFLRLLDVLKGYTRTGLADERIAGMRPLNSQQQIQSAQDRIEALIEVVKWEGPVPLNDIPDVRAIVRRLTIEESVLEIGDFIELAGFLSACRAITGFLKKAHERRPFIDEVLEGLSPLPQTIARINKTINAEGFIEDSASYELSKIRSDLFQFRERVKRQLERAMERDDVRPVLQDSYIAIRNGRYVMPLKPNFNQFLQGIVHDYSHSLKTSFVEPMEIVEANNQISVLEDEEKEEEKRILHDLTNWVRGYAGELKANLDIVADVDFYHGLALFSTRFNCVRPDIVDDGSMEVRGALNPFIILSRGEKAVPVDILLGRDKKVMIISGPNAGGKTVALKTIGLFCAMAASGLFVPARERPRIHLFPRIFAVIGDEQDIAAELSSFTAHVTAIKQVYEQSQGGELVLIDEIGGATDPQEASALAMGIMDAFVEKGSSVVVTTHLNLLKAYGYSQGYAQNVAADFDPGTMKPMYRLIYGTAGVSNALRVAENSDMPRAIMEKSQRYLGEQEQMLNDLVHRLEVERAGAEEERRRADEARDEARKRLTLIKEKRDEYLRSVEERCRRQVAELEMELDEIRREVMKKERSALKGAAARLERVREKRVVEQKAAAPPAVIHVGDVVKVSNVGGEGYVASIDPAGNTAEVVMGNLRMRVRKGQIDKVAKEKRSGGRERPIQVNVERVELPEINVMGLRVDEALEEVDRFMDRAIVHDVPAVRILHGIGTGRLMNAIRNHLSDIRYVKDVKKDEANSGVTIVELA
jgi:DNA mismatch repair protein MutS2